jgi:FkbM family methyltransferase
VSPIRCPAATRARLNFPARPCYVSSNRRAARNPTTQKLLSMNLKQGIQKWLRGMGYDVVRYTPSSHFLARRKRILDTTGTDVVLDVGANVGQYAQQLRAIGYTGRIISFEPLSSAYKELVRRSSSDDSWQAFNCALGNQICTTQINVSGNSDSSSILNMLPYHAKVAPESRYVGKEQIEVNTLDALFSNLRIEQHKIWMKIDTQGFEHRVLDGAANSLAHIQILQLEMSFVPLYEDQILFDEMNKILHDRGYRMISIEPSFLDEESGHMLQVDGIFHRP